jgi:hypothetical protein
MKDERVDKLLSGLRNLVEDFEPMHKRFGPLRYDHKKILRRKEDDPYVIHVESGWNWNYGGSVNIEASPKGKSLKVYITEQETTIPVKLFVNGKELKH